MRRSFCSLLLTAALLPPSLSASEDDAVQQSAAELDRCRTLSYADPNSAVQLADTLLQGADLLPPHLRLGIQACRGRALATLGQATDALEMALAIADGVDTLTDVEQQVVLLRDQAAIHQQVGGLGDAISVLERALARAVDSGLVGLEIELLTHIGVHHAQASQYGPAIAHLERALQAAEETGDQRRALPVRFNLGQVYRSSGRLEDAERLLSSLLPVLEAPGMEMRLAFLLSSLGWIALDLGRTDEAESRFQRSAELQADSHNPGEQTVLLNGMATVRLRRNDAEGALELAERSLELAEQTNDHNAIQSGLALKVEVLKALGRSDEALELERQRASLHERFLRDEQIERLNDLEAKLGLERQARELDHLRRVAELQTLALQRQRMAFAAALALIALALVGLYQQRRLNRRLDIVSRTDPLTGLLNRRALSEALSSRRQQGGVSWLVMLLDLDHFKRINDQNGHEAGDRVLTAVGTLLKHFSQEHDGLAARWGGEEFVMVLPAHSEDDVRSLLASAEQRIAELKIPIRQAPPVAVSASIGYARLDSGNPASWDRKWEGTLAQADQALYQAKQLGRARSIGTWPEPEPAN